MAILLNRKTQQFNPDKDIPELPRKVILVTGGNNGLGKESSLQLAKHIPTKIYLGARSEIKANTAITEIRHTVPGVNVIFLPLDLASFASVKKAVDIFLSENDRLDILMNNAGIMTPHPGLTNDGYEINFGTNHMGRALLTKLLIPIMEKTAGSGNDVPVINVSSALYKFAPKSGILFSESKTPLVELSTVARYGQSKLANIYFTECLAKRYPVIRSVALHPGVVRTSIADTSKESSFFFAWVVRLVAMMAAVDVETGALNQLWASVASSDVVKSGRFYYPVGKDSQEVGLLCDTDLVEKLWDWTEKELAIQRF